MSISQVFLLLFLMTLGANALGVEVQPDSLETDPLELRSTLPNGLQVVIRQIPDASLARVGVFFAAGSALEPDSLAGLAHLSEHLLTESSLNHPDGELIRRQTLYSTYRNAYTGAAYMQFDTECLPVFLPQILDLEADRLRGVVTDSVSFAREKEVVLQELAMRSRLTPTSEFLQSVFQASYPGHPFSRDVGGTAESVAGIEREDFMAFQDKFIRPQRCALVVKGPVDPANVLAEIENIFRMGNTSEPVPAETPAYPPVAASQHFTDSNDHTGMLVCLAFRIPVQDEEDAAWTAVLPGLMSLSGLRPTLWRVPGEAVLMLRLTSSYRKPSRDSGSGQGYSRSVFDSEQQSLVQMGRLWDWIADFRRQMLDSEKFPERLNKSIDTLYNESGNPGRSAGLGTSLVNGDPYLSRSTVEDLLENKKPGDLMEFLDRWVNTDRVMVGVSHGRDSDRQASIELGRKKSAPTGMEAESALAGLTRADIQPVLEEYAQAELIRLEQFTLYNGIPVTSLVIPDSNSWAMAGIRTFPGIKDMRPGRKPGITRIFNQVVNFDDRQRRNPDGPTTLKRLPFHLEFQLDWCSTEFSTRGKPGKISEIASAINRRVASREFNSLRWHSVIRWGGNYLRRGRDDRINAARSWRWGQILGSEHPAVGEWAPDPEACEDIKYKDLANLHKDYIQKTGNLQLLIAGDIPANRLKSLINPSLGTLDRWKPAETVAPPDHTVTGIHGKIIPDLTRGDIRLELTFPLQSASLGDADAITALTLDLALEESLTDLLREKEGLTYDVSTRTVPCPSGFFREISITCHPGHAPIVLDKVRDELRHITREGFTVNQIARARLKLTGRAIRNLTEEGSGLDFLMRLARLGGIPENPLQTIAAVKEKEVNALAVGALDPGNFIFTATGPMFEEDLEQFNLP